MSARAPRTVWWIVRLDGRRLDVRLEVDTTAPLVVEMIERAAADAGIVLERDEPERAA